MGLTGRASDGTDWDALRWSIEWCPRSDELLLEEAPASWQGRVRYRCPGCGWKGSEGSGLLKETPRITWHSYRDWKGLREARRLLGDGEALGRKVRFPRKAFKPGSDTPDLPRNCTGKEG